MLTLCPRVRLGPCWVCSKVECWGNHCSVGLEGIALRHVKHIVNQDLLDKVIAISRTVHTSDDISEDSSEEEILKKCIDPRSDFLCYCRFIL